jgi:hypothetical protein
MQEARKTALMYAWREHRSFFFLYLAFLLTNLVFMRYLEGPYVFFYWTCVLLMFPLAILRMSWTFARKLKELRDVSSG